MPFEQDGKTTRFITDFLDISFTGVGVEGGCPAEKDNAGCFFLHPAEELRPPELITVKKEFCDCSFQWRFAPGGAHGVSIGKSIPVPAADRLSQSAVYRAERRSNFLSAGAGKLCRAV